MTKVLVHCQTENGSWEEVRVEVNTEDEREALVGALAVAAPPMGQKVFLSPQEMLSLTLRQLGEALDVFKQQVRNEGSNSRDQS